MMLAGLALWSLSVLLACLAPVSAIAAEKIAATLHVKDGLGVRNRPVMIEARLVEKRMLAGGGLGGEPVELVVGGKVVAVAMTGGDGKAFLPYTPAKPGTVPLQVRIGVSPRVGAAEGRANLAVWEQRNPIVMVEMAALMEEQSAQGPLPGINLTGGQEPKPLPDAAEELAKLTQFLYRVIYVIGLESAGSDGFQAAAEARDWLQANNFPAGYVLGLASGANALGSKLDELHAEGWRTVKTGIGRTKTFAEAFLQRRLEAIIVPEPAKGEVPRKAKVAKEWKEVRKKL